MAPDKADPLDCITAQVRRTERSTAGRASPSDGEDGTSVEHGPLGVGQVHAVEYDGDLTDVSGGFRICETASRVLRAFAFSLGYWFRVPNCFS